MKIKRRQFLRLAGATAALAIPTALGYGLVREARGDVPPSLSPYAPLDVRESWPSAPSEASPILLLVGEQAPNPFGIYLAEILRAEGLNCFQIAYLSDLDRAPLDWYDLVLLAEVPLTDRQAELLGGYVAKGGRLVAMRPDARLAPLLGVERTGGSTAEGYLQVEASHPVGQGIAAETLQFHGTADHYRTAGADVVAWLASDAGSRTVYPAVTMRRYQEGWAALWAFDLARSVAYMRQGNPDWANQERDGGDGIRATDMFKGWLDLDRILIPQADEQQRLLANLLSTSSQGARPLPRLWYFPGEALSVFVATSDAHGNPASAIEDLVDRVEERGGHMSVYYTAFPTSDWKRAGKRNVLRAMRLPSIEEVLDDRISSPTPSQIADWRARGHEFGLHPYVEAGLGPGWLEHWQEFTGLGYGPVPPTTRTHRVLWSGWVETARAQASYGIRMNMDYYHWGPAFQNEAGEWVYGHMTGSGLPMRFVDENGRILAIYQQLTQLADDHLMFLRWGGAGWMGHAKLDAEAAVEVSCALLRRSVNDHCAVAVNFHADQYHVAPQAADERSHREAVRWHEGTLDCAAENGMPILSAEAWLRFTELRHETNLENVEWHSSSRLGFDVETQAAPDVELTLMVPLQHGGRGLSDLQVDGRRVKVHDRQVGGIRYGWVSVPAGHHQVIATYA